MSSKSAPIYPELQPYPATFARRPDGLQPIENAVWQDFRAANQGQIRALYFNVHCGTVPGLDDSTSDADNRLRSALWSKRVDVIAETVDDVWLIEVKANVRPSAVGQVLTYVPLIAARKASWAGARPILIAATFDPDALALCGTMGLACFGPPFSALPARSAT